MVNLRNFDLNLLVVFQAIMETRSVGAAADRVGMSPSAASHALARLRAMFCDELFRRSPAGLEPTTRAVDLYGEIKAGLHHISGAIASQADFIPAEAERKFTVQIADFVSGMVLPSLAKRLQAEAPSVSLDIVPFTQGDSTLSLDADIQIRFAPGRIQSAVGQTQQLFSDRFVVIMRPGHPLAGQPMDVALYISLNHVKLSSSATGTNVVDDALARRGLKRRIVLTVPSWFDLPSIIENTDLIAIVPSKWMAADARVARLVYAPLPLDDVSFSVHALWDVRHEHDPGQRWFRGLISQIFAEMRAGRSAFPCYAPDGAETPP